MIFRRHRLAALEQRVADLEAAAAAQSSYTPWVEMPPAVALDLPAHLPVVDVTPAEVTGEWGDEDDEDWGASFGLYL